MNAITAMRQLAMPSMTVSLQTRYGSFSRLGKIHTLNDEDPSPAQEASKALHLLDPKSKKAGCSTAEQADTEEATESVHPSAVWSAKGEDSCTHLFWTSYRLYQQDIR